MAEKRVSVRLAAVGGKQVKAEFEGIGEAGKRGFGKASREMEIANAKLAKFARRVKPAGAEKARINARGTAVALRFKTGRGQVTAPIFLLIPQVKLRKRLDLARDAEKVTGSVPGLILEKWVEGSIGK